MCVFGTLWTHVLQEAGCSVSDEWTGRQFWLVVVDGVDLRGPKGSICNLPNFECFARVSFDKCARARVNHNPTRAHVTMAELQPDDGDGSVDVGDVELDESRLAAAAVAAAAEGTGFTPLEVEPSGDMLLRHHHSDKPQLTVSLSCVAFRQQPHTVTSTVSSSGCWPCCWYPVVLLQHVLWLRNWVRTCLGHEDATTCTSHVCACATRHSWVTMGSLQSSVLGYGIFYSLRSCAAFQHFTPLENVVLQTTAVATATMPLAGGLYTTAPSAATSHHSRTHIIHDTHRSHWHCTCTRHAESCGEWCRSCGAFRGIADRLDLQCRLLWGTKHTPRCGRRLCALTTGVSVLLPTIAGVFCCATTKTNGTNYCRSDGVNRNPHCVTHTLHQILREKLRFPSGTATAQVATCSLLVTLWALTILSNFNFPQPSDDCHAPSHRDLR